MAAAALGNEYGIADLAKAAIVPTLLTEPNADGNTVLDPRWPVEMIILDAIIILEGRGSFSGSKGKRRKDPTEMSSNIPRIMM